MRKTDEAILLLRVFGLGFASGLPLALCLGTLTTWLADYEIKKSAIGFFALVGSPYALKFLWAHMVDHLPLPVFSRLLGQRRSWIILCQIGLGACIAIMAFLDPKTQLFALAVAAFCIAAFSATQDIAIDAMRIEMLEKRQQGLGAATLVTGYRVAMLVSSAGAIFLAHYFGWKVAYLGMIPFMCIGVITVLFSPEPPKAEQTVSPITHPYYYGLAVAVAVLVDVMLWVLHDKVAFFTGWHSYFSWIFLMSVNFIGLGGVIGLVTGKSYQDTTIAPFKAFFTRKAAWLILIFIVLYKCGDAFAGFMTGPFVLELGFSKAEYASYVKSLGFIATLFGGFLGGVLVYYWGLIKSLLVCGVLQMASNLLFVWLAVVGKVPLVLAFTIVGENLAGGMGTAAFVAYLSALCNKRFTATQYALLTSFASYGRTFLTASSGSIAGYGWVNFFLFSTALAIPGLVMIFVLGKYLKATQD